MRQFIYYHPVLYRRMLAAVFTCTMAGGMISSFNLELPSMSVNSDVAIATAVPAQPATQATLKSLPGKDGSAPVPQPQQSSPLPAPAAAVVAIDGDARALGKAMNSQMFGDAEWPALQALWTRESGWNPVAKNRWSGACGIPQALPCSKIGAVNADGSSAVSAADQISWGLNYIKARYGTPSGAWRHEQSHGWY